MSQTIVTPIAEPVAEEITYEAFLQKYVDVHAEYLDGKVNVLMTASDKHQNISDWLTAILRLFIEAFDLGWIRSAPFNMRLPDRNYGREPDILFVSKNRLDIIESSHLTEPADLVIEIISPESVGRDRGDKFIEYETAGIPEYWLIDPDRKLVEFYQLIEAGYYQPAPFDEKGRFHSMVLPGFWLKVEWLWQEPLPKVMSVARALDLLDK